VFSVCYGSGGLLDFMVATRKIFKGLSERYLS